LVKSFQDTQESLIRPITYEELRGVMNRLEEDFSLVDPRSCVCFIMLFYVVELLKLLCCWNCYF